MKQLFLIAGAAALGLAGAAMAKPGHGNGRGHGHGYVNAYGYGIGGCPPASRKSTTAACRRARRRSSRAASAGRAFYGSRYAYSQIPYDIRNRYDLDPRDRYYYGNGYLYQVDPRTLLVQQVISALLR